MCSFTEIPRGWDTVWPCSGNSSMFFPERPVLDFPLLSQTHTGTQGEILVSRTVQVERKNRNEVNSRLDSVWVSARLRAPRHVTCACVRARTDCWERRAPPPPPLRPRSLRSRIRPAFFSRALADEEAPDNTK